MANLLPGETVVMRRHPHWVVAAKAMLLPLVLVILVGVGDKLLRDSLLSDPALAHDIKVVATLAVIAIFGLWAIVTWVRWNATAFTITDQRVILDQGVLGRSSKIIPIDRVQDVSTRQTLLGRILGYGQVEIDAAGARGAEVLEYLPAPNRFRDQVFVESENFRKQTVAAPAPPAPAPPAPAPPAPAPPSPTPS
jgi:uncharacterized membrane protein YdbT with pleckstrin-like domain